jgi:hypothetical protein
MQVFYGETGPGDLPVPETGTRQPETSNLKHFTIFLFEKLIKLLLLH